MKLGRKLIVALCSALVVSAMFLAGCASNGSTGSKATDTTATVASGTSATSASKTQAATSVGEGSTTYVGSDGTTYAFNLVNDGELTVGSDCDYPPFISMDGDTPVGFEADMLTEMCSRLGIKLNYLEPQKFDTLITTVENNTKMDIACSSFTITDERKEEIDFTDPYFDSNQGVIVLSDSGYSDYSDLAGKTVCAQSGTTGEAWAQENIPNCTMKALDTVTDCMNAVAAGQAEAAIFDLPVAVEQVKGNFTQCKIINEVPTGEQYGLVVSKDNPGLTAALNSVLADMKADGTYDKLYDQYFDY